MSTTQPLGVKYTAGGAIPRGAACKISSGTTVVVTTAATERVVGFAIDTYESGDEVVLQVNGAIRALSNGTGTAIAAGGQLSPGAGGKLVALAATTGHRAVAVAQEASALDGKIITIVFDPVQQTANA